MQKRSDAREPLLNSISRISSSLGTVLSVISDSDVSQYLPASSNKPSGGITDPAVDIMKKNKKSSVVKALKHYPSTCALLQIPIDQRLYEVVIDNTDPGLEWMAMMNDRNACVSKVDWSKSPLNVKVGMRLVKIDNLIVQDQPFEKIMCCYNSAIKATSEPATLVFADGAKNLNVSADVASALVWKKTMEMENYNSNLRNRAVLFVDGLHFQCFMLIVIGTDFSMICIDHSHWNSFPLLWIQVVYWVILSIYALEILARIYGYSISVYFHKCYCVFDFLVVLACFVLAFLRHTRSTHDVKI